MSEFSKEELDALLQASLQAMKEQFESARLTREEHLMSERMVRAFERMRVIIQAHGP